MNSPLVPFRAYRQKAGYGHPPGKGNWARYRKDGKRVCARPACTRLGVYREGMSLYCLKCRRIRQMVMSARRRYPALTITKEQLEKIILTHDMRCGRCHIKMIWGCRGIHAPKARIITLQHWPDDAVSFLCHRCNVTLGARERWNAN